MQEVSVVRGVCVCSILHPPLYLLQGATGEKLPILSKPPLGAYETSPRVWIKAMGPTGRSADQAGRPACQWRQPPPASSGGLFWAALFGPR